MNRKRIVGSAIVVGSLGLVGLAALEADHRQIMRPESPSFGIEVSITNITRGQIFSPAIIYAHSSDMMPLFTLGAPASDELAAVAEDAMNDPLIDKLSGSSQVRDVQLATGENGPILPGETVTKVIDGSRRASWISLVGMMVTTNDGFYAMRGQRAPTYGERSFLLRGYDAGSEANNELCSHIPGPPCGNPGVRATEGAEGFVHVHSGIHGVGDLESSESDWKNPVARVTLRRVRLRK